MEICVDSIESVKNACEAGAARIELCSALSLGGLTPTLALFRLTKLKYPHIPLFVMIRPREGDFEYSQSEVEEMKLSIEMFLAAGADGFVFGCLKTVKVGHHSNTGLMVDAEALLEFFQAVDAIQQ
ncbi:copper homeostasis protein cutC homolog isoform X2 [Convolutriloba macropyga]|uniref:copper homeostasis protein cutC homolog isoform X2 n=1 Tax=Convolutriloba macropyga TaxID=536237 RepID=UPI003F5262AB